MGAALFVAVLGLVVWASITARHETKCPACGDVIHEGDQIRLVDDEWVHAECAE